jgi:hypothetical protein
MLDMLCNIRKETNLRKSENLLTEDCSIFSWLTTRVYLSNVNTKVWGNVVVKALRY